MKKNVVRILTAVLMLSVVFSSSVFAAEKQKSAWESFVGLFTGNAVTVADTQVDGVTYQTHIQNDGWKQGWVSDGKTSGSEGRGLRLEGIEIKIDGDDLPDGLGVTYRTQIENDGWLDWETDGDTSGSVGKGLRLEAIEIELTGDDAGDYSIGYRTHIQNYGWEEDWVYNGDTSGTVGEGLRLEGIQIEIFRNIPDLTEYEAALAAVTQADYTAASWTAYQAVVNANVVDEDNLVSEVEEATAAITAAQANLVKVLKVESVSAINAKQVEVTFNQDVTALTLTKSNFTVTQTNDATGTDRLTDSSTATNKAVSTQVVNTGVIEKSGSKVILAVDENARFTNGTTVTVTTTGVKLGTDTMADVTKTAILNDVTAPTAVSATSIGSNQVKLVFSEPIYDGTNDNATDIKTNFKINDGGIGITEVKKSLTEPNAVIIKTAADLTKGTEYTITVNPTSGTQNVQDYVNYKLMTDTKVKFTHTTSSDVPTVTGAARTEKVVRLTFSKPVTIPVNANVEFRYAYNATGAVKTTAATGAAVVADTNRTQWDITLPSSMTPGTGNLYIAYVAAANSAKSNVIVDDYGNVVPTGTMVDFTVTADTNAPTATVTYKTATTIDVKFSKTVTGATTASNYTVKDPNGSAVAISNIASVGVATDNTYRLTVATMQAGGNFTVAIGNGIKDTSVAQNAFVPQTFTITVPDTKAPTADLVTKNAGDNVVYVYYSEAMGSSALSLTNYRLVNTDGTPVQFALPAGTTITQTGTRIAISLPDTLANLKTTLGSATALSKLFIGAVSDVAGNQIATLQSYTIAATTTTFTETVSNGKLYPDSVVKFDVNRQLSSVNAAEINKDATTTGCSAASFVNNADGTATVTATFAASTFGTATAASAVTLDIDAGALTDLNGLTSDGSTSANFVVAGDYAAPLMNTATTKDTNNNGKIDAVDVVFSEAIAADSASLSDFTVAGYPTITAIAGGGTATLTLTIAEGASPDTGVTPTVTLVGAVDDNITPTATQPRNTLSGSVALTGIDGAKPVLMSTVLTNTGTVNQLNTGDNIAYTFSEAIDTTTVTGLTLGAANSGLLTASSGSTFTFATKAATDGTGSGTTAWSNSNQTVTLTIGTVTAAGSTSPTGAVTIGAAGVKDAAGLALNTTTAATTTTTW